jgi:sulfate/thiosulfate transport system ATP-binding protein
MSIVLDRLSKLFRGHPIVDRVSLELVDGEFFVMLGASGSGKSTILRLIAGLVQPDDGRILLNGRDVTFVPPQDRGTGFVFQNYSIFRHMSVSQNVEFGLKIRNVPVRERAGKSEQLLDLVGLAGLGDRFADQLSGGQLQRVALARALAYEPKILLLDEPFGALDSKIRAQLRRSLKEIQRRLRVTTILVTHDQEEAFELADRLGVIERGRLLETGPPAALYSTPKTLFVATFLGAGTVLIGRALAGQASFGGFSLPIPPENFHEEGSKVHVLFRPEQVALSSHKPGADLPIIGNGTVVEQSYSGPFKRVRVRLPHLASTRQAAPTLPFGEEGILVDAIVPPDLRLDAENVWASLRAWHILESPRLHFLIYVGEASGWIASPWLPFARVLSKKTNASITLLATGATREFSKFQLDQLKRVWPDAELQLRRGNLADQIEQVQQTGNFDLMIVGAGSTVSETLLKSLERSTIPVLVIRKEQEIFKRILICTAAGEPGKNDVLVGGRLARWMDAAVTLLYVSSTGYSGLSEIARRHLNSALATLRGLEVGSSIKIRAAVSPRDGILGQTESGDHDLIVLGIQGFRPRLRARFRSGLDPITAHVLQGTDRSILVVPANE